MERSLFYSAFVIRKLMEGSKLTDRVSALKIDVSIFEAIQQQNDHILRTVGHFEFGRDYKERPSHKIQMKLSDLTSEIIHSFPLLWCCDERGFLNGFFVSSFRNEKRRLLHVPLHKYAEKIDIVANDDVLFTAIEMDPSSGNIKAEKR